MWRLTDNNQGIGFGALALFASFGTLLCCALPIVLVTLGLGSTVAAVTFKLPFLVVLSGYHNWMFSISALLLGGAAWFVWTRNNCPADPELAAACVRANKWSKRILLLAVAIWVTGAFSAYLMLPLRQWLST
jgi:hypothetical protein